MKKRSIDVPTPLKYNLLVDSPSQWDSDYPVPRTCNAFANNREL